jgi:hypothetical protein
MKSAKERFENWKIKMKIRRGGRPVDRETQKRTRAAFVRQYEIQDKTHDLCNDHGLAISARLPYMAFANSADKQFRNNGEGRKFRIELDILIYTWTRRGCDEALLKQIAEKLFDPKKGSGA